MAQQLHGRLSNYKLVGITRLSGHLGDSTVGRPGLVDAEGALSAAGVHGPPNEAPGAIPNELPGGTYLVSSTDAVQVRLPVPSAGRSFRFILGEAPGTGSHVIDSGETPIHGGIVNLEAVPPGEFANGSTKIHFNSGSSAGARISLYADGQRWYVADGLANEPQAITFSA